jgi:uncharacterized protein YutE (UPF0331/DUF86 family)
MDANDVRGKLDVLAANQKQLEWLRGLPEVDFQSDVRNLDSALHRLQTSIQALVDIGVYIVGSLKLPTPEHSADVLIALRDAGLLDPTATADYVRMVAFRNRVVHLYNRIDPNMVYAILQNHVKDIETLREVLLDIIANNPDQPLAS